MDHPDLLFLRASNIHLITYFQSISFTNSEGILEIIDTYNELHDPGRPIPAEVTKVTGIRDEDVQDKVIDWDFVLQLLNKTDLIICHQSKFDRNFLELQTPSSVHPLIQSMLFACTINDIDWKEGLRAQSLII